MKKTVPPPSESSVRNVRILAGDSREVLPLLEAESIRCCVTSPPYWGLRDYDHPSQVGAEESPEHYVENLVAIFREVRRVLCKDGTLWLNVGDGYARNGGGYAVRTPRWEIPENSFRNEIARCQTAGA